MTETTKLPVTLWKVEAFDAHDCHVWLYVDRRDKAEEKMIEIEDHDYSSIKLYVSSWVDPVDSEVVFLEVVA